MFNSKAHTEYSRHLIHQIMTFHVFTEKNPDTETYYSRREKEDREKIVDFAKFGIMGE